MSKPKLISFALCPFVQRSVILLKEKKIDFDIEYIDLANKPDWFLKISPFGKVPVLQVGDSVIFESAVIAEYLDEVNPPSMHPADPITKAVNRAWIEFTSSLFMAQYHLSATNDEEEFNSQLTQLKAGLARLEDQIESGPFFNGSEIYLIDFSAAPLLQRLSILTKAGGLNFLEGLPKVNQWSSALLARDTVQSSVLPDFEESYLGYIQKSGSYFGKTFLS